MEPLGLGNFTLINNLYYLSNVEAGCIGDGDVSPGSAECGQYGLHALVQPTAARCQAGRAQRAVRGGGC